VTGKLKYTYYIWLVKRIGDK